MNIGEAAQVSGLPAKTIRYYETLGLVTPERCPGNDYRDYSATDVAALVFLQRGRAAGFSLAECRELLAVYRAGPPVSVSAQSYVEQRLEALKTQIATLEALQHTFEQMLGAAAIDMDSAPLLDSSSRQPEAGMAFLLVDN